MLKEELRLHYLKLRRGLSPEAVEDYSISIANQLLQLPIWALHYYHIFLSISHQKEVNTEHLLTILHGKDKQVVVPRVSGPDTFQNILLTDATRLVKSTWGVPEPADGLEVPPEKIDLVFLPLLAFDRSGHRVGYGKGYYDRFLDSCRKDVVKIGLSFFEAVEQIEDVHEGDRVMDYCICPEKIYRF